MRRQRPPADERLYRKWCADRLEEETQALLKGIEDETGDLDDLFAELDATLAHSRQVSRWPALCCLTEMIRRYL